MFRRVKVPPLIIIREDKARDKSESLTSIIEHEMVHVNQVLLGCFPALIFPDSPRETLTSLMSVIKAEYHANLLQLTKWPHLFAHTEIPRLWITGAFFEDTHRQ